VATLPAPAARAARLTERLVAFRTKAGLSQAQVTQAMRGLGFPSWKRATYALVETGGRHLADWEIGALLNLFTAHGVTGAQGGALTYLDLFPEYDLTRGQIVPVGAPRVVDVSDVVPTPSEGPVERITEPQLRAAVWSATMRRNAIWQRVLGRLPDYARQVGQDDTGAPIFSTPMAPAPDWVESHLYDEVTEKASRVLKVPAEAVVLASWKCWAHDLETEREIRVATHPQPSTPRALQAVRGHVTRVLQDELRSALKTKNTTAPPTAGGPKKAMRSRKAGPRS